MKPDAGQIIGLSRSVISILWQPQPIGTMIIRSFMQWMSTPDPKSLVGCQPVNLRCSRAAGMMAPEDYYEVGFDWIHFGNTKLK